MARTEYAGSHAPLHIREQGIGPQRGGERLEGLTVAVERGERLPLPDERRHIVGAM